jgi:hypothetical protein
MPTSKHSNPPFWPDWVPPYTMQEDLDAVSEEYLGQGPECPSLSFDPEVPAIMRRHGSEVLSWAKKTNSDVLAYAHYWCETEDEVARYVYVRALQDWADSCGLQVRLGQRQVPDWDLPQEDVTEPWD